MNKDHLDSYLQKMVGKIFKVLPLLESDEDKASKYIDNLLIELKGAIKYFDENSRFIDIVFSLEGLKDTHDYNLWKSKVFECIDIVNKMK